MRLYGLIGKSLKHSLSPVIFNKIFEDLMLTDIEYKLYELENVDMIINLVKIIPELEGFNVTIPYKQQIIPFLNDLDHVSKSISAVNTVKIKRSISKIELHGYNTDVMAFEQSLLNFIKDSNIKALILGNGGAAKAVKFVLNKLGIAYQTVSRQYGDACILYSELNKEIISEHKLIVNTTPLGMYSQNDTFPDIPYQFLTSEHYLYDLVYNPEITIFLNKGRLSGSKVKNGLEMLNLQAKSAWNIWNGYSS